ncbi:hypothetical protein [Streptosporangium amethystogenes]|uniref:hypothetical protein n=1 Tax=Streptosporangium amethystogenes TaxID=2002 RepID=UPI001B80D822|nr:hypothetical protein [Streptosporangium amethystogenes]
MKFWHGMPPKRTAGAVFSSIGEARVLVMPGNDASVAVCRRLGMIPVGLTGRL